MRDLKFRVWWKDESEPTIYTEYDLFDDTWTNHERIAIEQYTGFKDKNGKEIYEGDILREKGLLSLTYLEWDKNHARYKTKVLDESKHVSTCFDFDIIDALECEVVGNIHENPELLGGRVC